MRAKQTSGKGEGEKNTGDDGSSTPDFGEDSDSNYASGPECWPVLLRKYHVGQVFTMNTYEA